jgi:glucose-6-phosphate 1-dehydrogenase
MKEGTKAFAADEFQESDWSEFSEHLFYHRGEFEGQKHYDALAGRLDELIGNKGNVLHYLATAPEYYPTVIHHLADSGLLAESDGKGYRRIIIEKPFGRDLPSALALNRGLHHVLKEEQIYRIDHYLGKETVQNVIVFRFGNAIFEPLWNRNYIDHVQISVAETVGVGHRARYYDTTGALRDMFQNHLLQILTLVAMEPPSQVEANALRDEKVKVLRALQAIAPEHAARHAVRAQYAGYRSEQGVDPASTTETYAAVRLNIDNWRWQGVPFYLRSGKMLKNRVSEIVVQFRRPPTQIFDVQSGVTELFTNRLIIRIQPDEALRLRFVTKVPDRGMVMRPVDMDFHYQDSFGEQSIPEAYERLLLDALRGDASLFARSDEIELAWNVVDGIRAGWEGSHAPPLTSYEPGSWGPGAADQLLWRDLRWWIQDDETHRTPDGR